MISYNVNDGVIPDNVAKDYDTELEKKFDRLHEEIADICDICSNELNEEGVCQNCLECREILQ